MSGAAIGYGPGGKRPRPPRRPKPEPVELCPTCGQVRIVARDGSAMTLDCDLCRQPSGTAG